MTFDNCQTPQDTLENLQKIRSYKPFQYSGKWYVSAWNNVGTAYRSMQTLKRAMQRDGITTAEVLILK